MFFRLTSLVGSLDDFSISGGIVSLDVRVNRLLYKAGIQLGLGKQAPHCWLVAPLCKLIGTVQVVYVHDQHLNAHTIHMGRKEIKVDSQPHSKCM